MTDTKSLLEYSIKLLTKNGKPTKMNTIIKKIMANFNLSQEEMDELAPQFLLDFMTSGYFWFCNNDTWDLKERQPLSDIENDAFTTTTDEDEEAAENELKDEDIEEDEENKEEDDEEDDEDDDEEDDIEKEIEEEKDDIEKELEK